MWDRVTNAHPEPEGYRDVPDLTVIVFRSKVSENGERTHNVASSLLLVETSTTVSKMGYTLVPFIQAPEAVCSLIIVIPPIVIQPREPFAYFHPNSSLNRRGLYGSMRSREFRHT